MDNEGIVYILTNLAMPDLIKIGITGRSDLDERLKELYTTSVPLPFTCEYACKVKDYKNVESSLHFAFEKDRVNPKREFFRLAPEKVRVILKLLSLEDITDSIATKISVDSELSKEDVENAAKKLKRPILNYPDIGIEIGSKLKFAKDENIDVEVANDRKVKYNNEIVSLTYATQSILNTDNSIRPAYYWKFNGKLLSELYEEKYGNES